MNDTSKTDVLIVGAGPTGLALALWLARLGVRVRIIDTTAGPGTTSRALAVQARTLEFYNQIGIAQEVVDQGRRMTGVHLWVKGKEVARAAFDEMGTGLSPFPFALVFPQDEHEQLLINHVSELGIHVGRQTELIGFDETSDGVRARLKLPDASEQICEAAFIAGCDGAHSVVRQSLGIGFAGGMYAHLFYVADVTGTGQAMSGEINVALDTADFLAVFPLKEQGRARLVGTVRDDAQQVANLSWNDVSKRVIDWMHIDVQQVNWFSTYHVHHRVAAHFRQGRAFLLGDAAHIHSPVGGQGMNTGIGDAVNLAWKLACVIHGRAAASILDTYEPERIAFAQRLVETTDQAFIAVTDPGRWARFVRLEVVPLVIPMLFAFSATRRFLFRTVSQTAINYRPSRLSEGHAGAIQGGDRLPWVSSDQLSMATDNFAPLRSLDWQVHVYGVAAPAIQAECSARRLPLHVFPWREEIRGTGLQKSAMYLIRPDGYVGLADATGNAASLATYLDGRNITAAADKVPT